MCRGSVTEQVEHVGSVANPRSEGLAAPCSCEVRKCLNRTFALSFNICFFLPHESFFFPILWIKSISESLTSEECLFCILCAVRILNESRKIQSLPLGCLFI